MAQKAKPVGMQPHDNAPDYANTGVPLVDLIDAMPRMAEVRNFLRLTKEAGAWDRHSKWTEEWRYWYFRIPELSLAAMPTVARFEKSTDLHIAIRDFAQGAPDNYDADADLAKELATRLKVIESVEMPEVSAARSRYDTAFWSEVAHKPGETVADTYPAFRDEVRRLQNLPTAVKERKCPTMGELVGEVGISDTTFGRIRDFAGIKVKERGGAARKRTYTPEEVDRLIAAAHDHQMMERQRIAEKWGKWSTKPPSKPHGSI
jgi:hypothetical protein